MGDMKKFCRIFASIFMLVIGISLIEAGVTAEYADAKSMKGGRVFKMSPSKKAPAQTTKQSTQQNSGGFGRGLAGGLLGGALGGMLFGSMFGAGGTGMGILPLLLLGVGAYFLFKKFSRPKPSSYEGYGYPSGGQDQNGIFGGNVNTSAQPPPVSTPNIGEGLVAEGLEQIRQNDRLFDLAHFKEVASDVFFQVQAGWMRRDLDSYRHLLGTELAGEYEHHFEEMRKKGQINKLESIAIRNVEIVQAGSDGQEDFITILFAANLLDYTVDDKSGELIQGSMTTPVKFEEEWTWARPTGTQDWKLEGIK